MINGQGSGSMHAYQARCTFPQTGRTTASQQGDKVIVSYYLPGRPPGNVRHDFGHLCAGSWYLLDKTTLA